MRLGSLTESFENGKISIHAPAWDATTRYYEISGKMAISIHAPAWDATFHSYIYGKAAVISIHAPAWDATICTGNKKSHEKISIHAPAWDATTLCKMVCKAELFQSTHPRGMRPNAPW